MANYVGERRDSYEVDIFSDHFWQNAVAHFKKSFNKSEVNPLDFQQIS